MSLPPRYDPRASGQWPDSDLRPAPGGVEGRPVDYVRWHPPDTPYLWGQGFPTPFGLNYFSQWTRQFLPTTRLQLPANVPLDAHMYPTSFGQNGTFQNQLNGAVPQGTVSQSVFDRLEKSQDHRSGTSVLAAIGSFGRV